MILFTQFGVLLLVVSEIILLIVLRLLFFFINIYVLLFFFQFFFTLYPQRTRTNKCPGWKAGFVVFPLVVRRSQTDVVVEADGGKVSEVTAIVRVNSSITVSTWRHKRY